MQGWLVSQYVGHVYGSHTPYGGKLMNRGRVAVGSLVAVACLGLVSPALAQTTVGVRAGVSADPDQFFVGGHIESPRLGGLKIVSFRPNLEVGFGDNVKVIAGNVEFVAWLSFPDPSWAAYLGGGPAVNIIKFDDNGTDIGGGFNIVAGFQHRSGLFTEIKVGMNDSPGLRGTVGYVFRAR